MLLLLPVGVLMESLRCWYLAWYFSFMWLVWSLMLWLCFTPPEAARALVASTEGWCLQEPPPCRVRWKCNFNTLNSPLLNL